MAGSYGWNISKEFMENERGDERNETIRSTPQRNEIPEPRGHFWYPSSGDIPPGAIKAGVDKDGGAVFVGRAFHQGEIIPAKILAHQNLAYLPWGGEEHSKGEFEILCRGTSTVIWQECSGGQVPPSAVAAGTTSEGERLYVGRVFHDGTLTPGKVQPSHGACYIPYAGQEISFPTYEVLLLQ